MSVAWYNPESDVVVVQDFDSGKEFIFEYDWDYIDDVKEAVAHMVENIARIHEARMFYGKDYNPLEHGLWVRLGVV